MGGKSVGRIETSAQPSQWGDHSEGWFVVQTHPRRERFVEKRLQDLELESFLPLLMESRYGRSNARMKPLFPGYMFAALSPVRGDLPRVRWLHGVKRLLGDAERPRPIPGQVVQELRARADARGCVHLGWGLQQGDRVRILEGPFAGLVGILEGHLTRPKDRVHVLLDMFARTARVEVPAASLAAFRS
jgi:transcriptional antiterminator RfaH